MTSAVYTTSGYRQAQYRQQATHKRVADSNKAEVTFVPTLVELQIPARKLIKAFQWRRQLQDLVGGFVSGAVSLR